jgi:hypothetical protein
VVYRVSASGIMLRHSGRATLDDLHARGREQLGLSYSADAERSVS